MKRRKAVMVVPRHGGARGRVHGAERRLADVDLRRLVQHRIGRGVVRVHLRGIDAPGVQKAQMRGVDVAFERLQPIALAVGQGDVSIVRIGGDRGLDLRKRRRLGALAHVDEHHAAALGGLVGLGLHAGGIFVLVRQIGLIEAIAVDVELPAVIAAAKAVILVAAEEQRRQAVRAEMIKDADPAGRVAECDQLLAQQHQAHLRAVGLKLRRQAGRNPELPHELAHRRVAADARQELVLGCADHLASPALLLIVYDGLVDDDAGLRHVSQRCGKRRLGGGCIRHRRVEEAVGRIERRRREERPVHLPARAQQRIGRAGVLLARFAQRLDVDQAETEQSSPAAPSS